MPPFIVLHVCTGNICRSPMSERFLAHYVAAAGLGPEHLLNHSAGTSAFHEGEDMQSNSRAELTDRGVDAEGFASRPLSTHLTSTSELILTATDDHRQFACDLDAEAEAKTFLVRQLGRIAADFDTEALPALDGSAQSILKRGQAFVAEAHTRRGEYEPLRLDDPWSLGRATYTRIADQLEEAIRPIAEVLVGSR
ncbi:phosphotyrosine protein phosphatase [Natronoglycomyces albus]|uniref:Phosphotyrosine protein phosphatase n=1 Tax=Natronoglycomyces albus TaxID=2811108 RepID=A0A895XK86_9ACTN|nr:phosphotyrosine protein phosphatase [Natronoglycomyces albus]QSB06161.1 phosphotyrosine protein phosphatase [Natronoglycomyces albus]